MATITAASATFTLSVDTLFPVPQVLQGYAVNDAFTSEDAEIAETQIGVDGVVVSGWLPRLTPMDITFLASSDSVSIFEQWMLAMDNIQDILYGTGTIAYPAVGKVYYLNQGTLSRVSMLPSARRVLEQRRFRVTWGWPITSGPIPVF